MKKTVSYSLWGDNNLYYRGLFSNYNLIKDLLPDYNIKLYISDSFDKNKLHEIRKNLNIEIKVETILGKYSGMYWRFLECENSDITLVRDLDSRISEREVNLIREWENSKYKFHIIRDHYWHKMPIMGGMWGIKGNIYNINKMINDFGNFNTIDDQIFLKEIIFPIISDNCLEHTSTNIHFCDNYIDIKKSNDGSFIGERINEYENPLYPFDRDLNLGKVTLN